MGGTFKPLLELDGVSVLERSVRPFLDRSDVHWLIVALPPELAATPPHFLMRDVRVDVVAGGAERGDSVRNALVAVPMEADIVLVHDAARPLVSAEVIERCVAAATQGVSAIAAVPVTDTIKEVDAGGRVIRTPDRRTLWAAQTPQAFPAEVLRNAHARAGEQQLRATDDAALVAHFGCTVVIVEGAPENIKITTQADIAIAEALLGVTR
jgi:2-C-methyl-D-erythritol 4-phosphate cytidylyltransferase